MGTNVLLLFDLGKYEARKSVGQLEFETKYRHVLRRFSEVVPVCFNDMKRLVNQIPISERLNGLNSYILNGMVCGRMAQSFPDICKPAEHGRLACKIDNIEAYFKKLDEHHMPSNVLTANVQAIKMQLRKRDSNAGAVVIIGYVIDDYWNSVEGLYAVYINGNTIVWQTDINTLFKNDSDDIQLGQPNVPAGPNEPTLKGRSKKSAPGNN